MWYLNKHKHMQLDPKSTGIFKNNKIKREAIEKYRLLQCALESREFLISKKAKFVIKFCSK